MLFDDERARPIKTPHEKTDLEYHVVTGARILLSAARDLIVWSKNKRGKIRVINFLEQYINADTALSDQSIIWRKLDEFTVRSNLGSKGVIVFNNRLIAQGVSKPWTSIYANEFVFHLGCSLVFFKPEVRELQGPAVFGYVPDKLVT